MSDDQTAILNKTKTISVTLDIPAEFLDKIRPSVVTNAGYYSYPLERILVDRLLASEPSYETAIDPASGRAIPTAADAIEVLKARLARELLKAIDLVDMAAMAELLHFLAAEMVGNALREQQIKWRLRAERAAENRDLRLTTFGHRNAD